MDLSSVLTRNTDSAYRIYDGQATVVLPGRAEVKVINAPGSLIWDQLDGVRSLADILKLVLDEYEITPEQGEKDLLEFVAALHEQGMVG